MRYINLCFTYLLTVVRCFARHTFGIIATPHDVPQSSQGAFVEQKTSECTCSAAVKAYGRRTDNRRPGLTTDRRIAATDGHWSLCHALCHSRISQSVSRVRTVNIVCDLRVDLV